MLLVTWMRTAQAYKEAKRLDIQAPVVTMLFRDGKTILCVVTSSSFAHMEVRRNDIFCVRFERNYPNLETLILTAVQHSSLAERTGSNWSQRCKPSSLIMQCRKSLSSSFRSRFYSPWTFLGPSLQCGWSLTITAEYPKPPDIHLQITTDHRLSVHSESATHYIC